jgi:hypothetical protein
MTSNHAAARQFAGGNCHAVTFACVVAALALSVWPIAAGGGWPREAFMRRPQQPHVGEEGLHKLPLTGLCHLQHDQLLGGRCRAMASRWCGSCLD